MAARGARAATRSSAAHRRPCRRGLEPLGPFREGLGDLGYIDGKNIQIEVRSAEGQDARLPELAAELVRSRVDVIVAVQTPAAHAAKNATRDIPIVVMAGDPIATGLITNLARPDGNLTGVSATAAEAAAKSLELITEIKPGARRVGVLGNADDPFMRPFFDQIQRGAPRVRLEVQQFIIRSSDELNSAFAAIASERARRRRHSGKSTGRIDGRAGAKVPAALPLDPKIRSAGGNSDVIQRELRGAGPHDR